MEFWDKKTRFRKSLQLKNINILIVETIIEMGIAPNESQALEMLIEDKALYGSILEDLKKDYPDINKKSPGNQSF